MTATKRLQARWPGWEIETWCAMTIPSLDAWQWGARPRGVTGFGIAGEDSTGCFETYATERGACQSCNHALKAIRKAVTE